MNKLVFKISAFTILLFVVACENGHKNQYTARQLKSEEFKGVRIDSSRVLKPRVVSAGKPDIIRAGKPDIKLTNLNVNMAHAPKVVLAGKPRVITPGVGAFPKPRVISLGDISSRTKLAGLPDIVIAKDPANKDQNPANFSTYGKPQGLKNSIVCCMAQDKGGNLWFGTYGGGASRYDGKSFANFTDKEGLCNVEVWCIFEDKKGNLWFGTNGGGISCYDGKSIINFSEKDGLCNNKVFSILEDRKGDVWFATKGGVSRYDGTSFTNFTTREGLNNNTVYSILQDKSGNLWFGTYGGGISRYDGTSFTNFTEKEGLCNDKVYCMLQDKNGRLWFGTGGGASCYDGTSFTNFTETEGLSSNEIWSILEDKTGNLWFGTNGGGVSRYDGNRIDAIERGDRAARNKQRDLKRIHGKLVKSFTTYTENEGLSNNSVYSILEDKIGDLWFGTYGGGSRYDGKSITNFTDKEGLNNNTVFSILEDKSKKLWFGTKGGGASCYDGKSFTNFTEKQGLVNNEILSILEDEKNRIWFGTNGGVSCYDGSSFINFTEKQGLCNNTILCMTKDKKGRIWFGSNGGGISCYDGTAFTNFTDKQGLCNNTVLSVIEDKQGQLWFGTNVGVSRYDGKRFTNYTSTKSLGGSEVWSILEDRQGQLWFGTNGSGVWRYNGSSILRFTEKEGLSNNTVWSITEDKVGNLWFGTRFGLSELTEEKLSLFLNKVRNDDLQESDVFFKDYSNADGFLGIGVNSGKTVLEAKDGTLWIAANDRLTAYHPMDGNQRDTVAPNIQLTGIELFNENIAWANLEQKKDSTLKLGNGVKVGNFEFDGLTRWYDLPEHLSLVFNNNYLTFNFIGITMNQSRSVKYQYRLDGLEESWSALTYRTSVPYGNLPHGNYTFKVKAMNCDGYWSREFDYTFTIRPPWWQTWWFRMLVILTVIALIWYYIKSREKKLLAEKEVLEKTVEMRTTEVVEQKHLIEQKHKEITDSINYAERIQRSFLASKGLLDENLGEHFVFFQPKDVVSGDFYWAASVQAPVSKELQQTDIPASDKQKKAFVLVTADSTGHGVPGAIMSLLNITSLEKAVEHCTEPADILNHTRKTIIERLKKDGSAEGGKDGMDCSLISFEFFPSSAAAVQKEGEVVAKLTYAAANNPVWILRKRGSFEEGGTGEVDLLELPPDKMPVGKHDKDNLPFMQRTVELQKGDIIYTLTDGMSDQFGGPKGKKFMYKRLKELLISVSKLPMHQQKERLRITLNEWKGKLEQVDDVCVIGIKI